MVIEEFEKPIDINEINTVLPFLTYLNFVVNLLFTPNDHLWGLKIDFRYITQESINALHQVYSNITELRMKCNNICSCDIDLKNRLQVWNNLMTLDLVKYSPAFEIYKLLLKKKGITKCFLEYTGSGWKYVEDLKASFIDAYIQEPQEPLIIFEV